MEKLKQHVEELVSNFNEELFVDFYKEFTEALNKGIIRAAEPSEDGTWQVNQWVKQGILLLFKYGNTVDFSFGQFKFFDKNTLPLKEVVAKDSIRIVPGGTSIRNGSFIAKGVIIMPPAYVNIGAYVDEGTLLDSHSLVGSCAQVGKRVHLSAASQIGGVLEPIGARPVIIEDDVFIGGNCGIYEGVLVRKGAVIAAGVILTSSTKVYDIVYDKIYQSTSSRPLEIPENAVVVSGSRTISTDFAKIHGLSIYTPIIIKYRDEKTNAKSALEQLLR
ncbi:2,3,4,5-tetrahydropyridine-2,6-dicarboxylate N-succinyltransferase [Bacteroidetes/Chlorobi group bacterium Naka2016]|nr:MAG: 2,3,4,5-tetrahydropyridine-2,6-dicarboxylate N-succinyltransferase [Bacteroidetes/Chlorobi group bacterium Naka2016]